MQRFNNLLIRIMNKDSNLMFHEFSLLFLERLKIVKKFKQYSYIYIRFVINFQNYFIINCY